MLGASDDFAAVNEGDIAYVLLSSDIGQLLSRYDTVNVLDR